jgi:hypothetical protein
MRAFVGSLLLVLAPASALAGVSAGGVVVSTENLGAMGDGVLHAGVPMCLGGQGFVVDGHRRLGGEGQYCGGPSTQMVFGGAATGGQWNLPIGYAAAQVGGGAGWIDAHDRDDDRFRSAFVYARPELAYGIPVGFGAVEAGLYVMVPLPLVQSLHGDMHPIASFTTTGLEVSVLFGDFRRRDRDPEPEPVAEVEPPPPPIAPPPPASAPPPVARGDNEGDDRPLAIPGGAPPPR